MNAHLNFSSALSVLRFEKLAKNSHVGDSLETDVTNGKESRHEAVAVGENFQDKSQKCTCQKLISSGLRKEKQNVR